MVTGNPGDLTHVKQILVGDEALVQSYFPDCPHDVGKTDILRADEDTFAAFGALPDHFGAQQFVLQAHSDHMDDLPGIKIRYCLADWTGATAGSTGKAAVEVFTTRQGGYLSAERSINLLTGYSHKEPLLKNFKKLYLKKIRPEAGRVINKYAELQKGNCEF
jgi:hypothetical protein